MYLKKEIDPILKNSSHKFVGNLTYLSFIRRLSTAFKDLKFKYVTYDSFEKDDYSFSGLYDWDKNIKYIILNLSSEEKSIYLTLDDYPYFEFNLSQAIQHETIHQDQWQNRPDGIHQMDSFDFKEKNASKREHMKYLSDEDEIDAYGHDIAMEIKYFYPTRNPYSVLKDINRTRKLYSYNYYKKTFRGVSWNNIKKKLFLKTFKWIEYV